MNWEKKLDELIEKMDNTVSLEKQNEIILCVNNAIIFMEELGKQLVVEWVEYNLEHYGNNTEEWVEMDIWYKKHKRMLS